MLGLWWAVETFLDPALQRHSEHQAETCQRLNGSSATGKSCGRSQRACLLVDHQLIFPLLAPLALGLSSLLGGPTPTVDSSVIAVLGMFAFSILPGSALGEEVGWRGFALPHLPNDHRALTAALILGPTWGFWHLPLWLTGSESNPLILFPAFVWRHRTLAVEAPLPGAADHDARQIGRRCRTGAAPDTPVARGRVISARTRSASVLNASRVGALAEDW